MVTIKVTVIPETAYDGISINDIRFVSETISCANAWYFSVYFHFFPAFNDCTDVRWGENGERSSNSGKVIYLYMKQKKQKKRNNHFNSSFPIIGLIIGMFSLSRHGWWHTAQKNISEFKTSLKTNGLHRIPCFKHSRWSKYIKRLRDLCITWWYGHTLYGIISVNRYSFFFVALYSGTWSKNAIHKRHKRCWEPISILFQYRKKVIKRTSKEIVSISNLLISVSVHDASLCKWSVREISGWIQTLGSVK